METVKDSSLDGQWLNQASLPPSISRISLLADRVSNTAFIPSLSARSSDYQRDVSKKLFQNQLMDHLDAQWTNREGHQSKTRDMFLDLVNILDRDGAALFGGLVDNPSFERLVVSYNEILLKDGSKNFLHSFVNLANDPDFLTNESFNSVFLHPLLIALIAYRMGGAVRIIDARGKDTQPISVLAQDNMLHIDNSPFIEEYKINLGWQKGTICGPSAQCFTYLPGTHRGTRKINVDSDGQPWSTENSSNFVNEAAVDRLFDFQKEQLGCSPTVVEAHYPEQPLTVVFDAGALVHHRYRTDTGDSRSCVILAFHLASDDPGTLLYDTTSTPKTLSRLLLAHQGPNYSADFLDALTRHADAISHKLAQLANLKAGPGIVDPARLSLSDAALSRWKVAVTSAPSVAEIKALNGVRLNWQAALNDTSLLDRLSQIMALDKYGRLDLILYADGHEEVRKRVRICIREMEPQTIKTRVAEWLSTIGKINVEEHLLSPKELSNMAKALAELTIQNSHVCRRLLLGTIAPVKAMNSAYQLAIDLGEAIVRCETLECFLATCLFMFWTADDLASMLPTKAAGQAKAYAGAFLQNYIASTVLAESIH